MPTPPRGDEDDSPSERRQGRGRRSDDDPLESLVSLRGLLQDVRDELSEQRKLLDRIRVRQEGFLPRAEFYREFTPIRDEVIAWRYAGRLLWTALGLVVGIAGAIGTLLAVFHKS